MGPARIYPWRKMHRSRAPSIAPGTFFVAQPWADCITNMPGFNFTTGTGKKNNWDLAAYEIDEIEEGLEDAENNFPTHDGIPVADMIKANIDPAVAELRKAVGAKSSTKFALAFDKLTSACNTCHTGANKQFIRIQRPTS